MATPARESLHALYQLQRWPEHFDEPCFRHYAGMKLGRDEDLDHYAAQLTVAADQMLHEHEPSARWLLTAPAYHQLPAAANLLAQRVQAQLAQRGHTIRLQELRLSAEQVQISGIDAFRRTYHYCASGLAQRLAERERIARSTPATQLSPFAGHKVLVLNDICVTGSQQRYLQRGFEDAGARSCHWLYVFHVEPNLGLDHPQIEQHINHCAYFTPADYATVLNQDASLPTVRAVNRLFDVDDRSFAAILDHLAPSTCSRLLQLIHAEDRYQIADFADRLHRLAAGARQPGRSGHVPA